MRPYYLLLDVAGVAADVLGAEVDAVGAGEGHAVDVLDDEGDLVDGLAVVGAGLVEGVPDEGGRVGEDPLGVVEADGLVEPLAAGGVGRRVRRVERDGGGRRRGRGQGQEGSDRGDVRLLHLVLVLQALVAPMIRLLVIGFLIFYRLERRM